LLQNLENSDDRIMLKVPMQTLRSSSYCRANSMTKIHSRHYCSRHAKGPPGTNAHQEQTGRWISRHSIFCGRTTTKLLSKQLPSSCKRPKTLRLFFSRRVVQRR
jgi:hypothetical protein